MLGGHSCPPPFKLVFDFNLRYSPAKCGFKAGAICPKSKVKGGGQECPPHTAVQSLSAVRFCGKTVCFGTGIGVLPIRSRHKIKLSTAVFTASGLVKSILADCAAP